VTKRSLWRLIVTLLICGACAYFFIPLSQVRLGLDLKGGVHFELEVQGHEALEADLRDTRDRLQDRLREKGFPDAVLKVEGDLVKGEGVPEDQRPEAEKVIQQVAGGYDASFTKTGFALAQKAFYQKALKDDANKRALQIIENRVNQFGVAEPEITATGAEGNRIVVELPGVGDAERERIKGLLTTPGRLEQRLVAKAIMNYDRIPKANAQALGKALGAELGLTGLEEKSPGQSALSPEEERQLAWAKIQELITKRTDAAAVASVIRDRLHAKYDADEIRQSWITLTEVDPMSLIRICCQLPFRADGKTDPIAQTVMETYVTRLMHEKYAGTYHKVVNSLRTMFHAKPDSPTLLNFAALVKWVSPEAATKLCADVGMPEPSQ